MVAKRMSTANFNELNGFIFSQVDVKLLTPELWQLGQGFRHVKGEL